MNVIVLAALLLMGDTVSPYGEDVTTVSYYIESGHYDAYIGSNAFNNAHTYWRASDADDCEEVCWIGQDFGYAQPVRVIEIDQYGAVTVDARIVEIFYSDNCSDYTSVDIYTLDSSASAQYIILPDVGSHQCWIIQSNEMYGVNGWIVSEIEMFAEGEDPVPPIVGTLESGTAYSIEPSASFGDLTTALLLITLCLILVISVVVQVIYGKRNT